MKRYHSKTFMKALEAMSILMPAYGDEREITPEEIEATFEIEDEPFQPEGRITSMWGSDSLFKMHYNQGDKIMCMLMMRKVEE